LAEEEPEEEAEERRVLPEVLPSEFKIGKKVLKVCACHPSDSSSADTNMQLFHRILEPPEEEKENAPTKGQVRWGDFENVSPGLVCQHLFIYLIYGRR
jgi:hypothetical protein